MEIQREVVRILDSFTELEARKAQYVYYRDQLLSIEDKCPCVPLRDLYERFITPIRDRPKEFDGNIPWCRIEDVEGHEIRDSKSGLRVSQDVVDAMSLKVNPVGTVLCSTSATLGVCAVVRRPLVTNQRFVGFTCKPNIDPEFLRYVLEHKTSELIRMASKSTITGITRKQLDAMLIPVPPLEEQRRLVELLDRFYLLAGSLNHGLPAEIAARRQQYEHCRDKLLAFPEKVA